MQALKSLNKFSGYAHWFLRVAIASVFLYHGFAKLPLVFQFQGMMGMPPLLFALVAFGEIGAGVLVILGAFLQDWMTRIAGLIVIIVMTGAVVMVHAPLGWSFMNNGAEFQVTLILLSFYLLLQGNGINRTSSSNPATT